MLKQIKNISFKNLNIFDFLNISFLIFSVLCLFSPFVYFSICFLNETVFGYGDTINYCIIKNISSNNFNQSEYQLIGVRRWRTNNITIGIYPTAKDAFNAANQIMCQVDSSI